MNLLEILNQMNEIDKKLDSKFQIIKGKYVSSIHFWEDENMINNPNYNIMKKQFNENMKNISSQINNLDFSIIEKKDLSFFTQNKFYLLKKIEFYKKTFDVEYIKTFEQKRKYTFQDINYKEYTNIIFQVDIDNLNRTWNKSYEINPKLKDSIPFKEMQYLVNTIKNTILLSEDIDFSFSDKFSNLAHNRGLVKIPKKDNYSKRTIITLFFHELTHFFRYSNWIKNNWVSFQSYDYYWLEEWIALYNEFFYWNQLTNIWEYIPLYDILYNILLEDENPEINKNRFIQTLLIYRQISESEALNYYKRFYRFSFEWSKNFLAKELVYNHSYEYVKKLISQDKYEEIMKWKIWKTLIDKKIDNLFWNDKNINSKEIFENILRFLKENVDFK